jgi:hypothetical protein
MMKNKRRRVYEEIKSAIEQQGGSMTWQRAGYCYGAWIVKLEGKTRFFKSTGESFSRTR